MSLTVKFELRDIDEKGLMYQVEAYLAQVRMVLKQGIVRKEQRITPSYEPRVTSFTNHISRPVEEIGLYNVEQEETYTKTVETCKKALACLDQDEQDLIIQRYFSWSVHDKEVMKILFVSPATYYRMKQRALLKLGFLLQMHKKPSQM